MTVRPSGRVVVPVTPVTVVLPVFVTETVIVTVSPAFGVSGRPLVPETTFSDETWARPTVTASLAVGASPLGAVAAAVAVFVTRPASTSAWVRVRAVSPVVVPVSHVAVAPGAREAAQVILAAPRAVSVIVTFVRVCRPVFVTTKW